VTGLDTRLLAERDTIRAVLGKNWRQAAVLTARPASVVVQVVSWAVGCCR
jgi:hypothetical protein